ncbi:hypothetical protein RUM43_003332 [Polyplax serrata]|uniref:Uncharacterized protein n=1 Tax=Polyplax serrata TaxID=468196 RepID=A0AAN8P350_POLSC
MIPTLPRDIVVPPSALKRRFAICTIRLVPATGRQHCESDGRKSFRSTPENPLPTAFFDRSIDKWTLSIGLEGIDMTELASIGQLIFEIALQRSTHSHVRHIKSARTQSALLLSEDCFCSFAKTRISI